MTPRLPCPTICDLLPQNAPTRFNGDVLHPNLVEEAAEAILSISPVLGLGACHRAADEALQHVSTLLWPGLGATPPRCWSAAPHAAAVPANTRVRPCVRACACVAVQVMARLQGGGDIESAMVMGDILALLADDRLVEAALVHCHGVVKAARKAKAKMAKQNKPKGAGKGQPKVREPDTARVTACRSGVWPPPRCSSCCADVGWPWGPPTANRLCSCVRPGIGCVPRGVRLPTHPPNQSASVSLWERGEREGFAKTMEQRSTVTLV